MQTPIKLLPDGVEIEQVNKGNRRWYEVTGDERVAGVELRNVSTVLNVIDKPGLRYWMVNEAYRKVKDVIDNNPLIFEYDTEEIIETARQLPDNTQARDTGTDIHDLIEQALKGDSGSVHPDHMPIVSGLLNYLAEKQLEIVALEQMVYHPHLKYAGTADLICQNIQGYLEILDFKTGKFYDEHLLQCAAYGYAVEETSGIEVSKTRVLGINPETHEITPHITTDYQRDAMTFIGALHIDRWMKEKNKSV